MVKPDNLNVKNKPDFNMYLMCIQCVFEIIPSSQSYHFSDFNKSKDYNGGDR